MIHAERSVPNTQCDMGRGAPPGPNWELGISHSRLANKVACRAVAARARTQPVFAPARYDALLDQGDTDGFTVCLKVVKAIETLQRKGPPEGEAVN